MSSLTVNAQGYFKESLVFKNTVFSDFPDSKILCLYVSVMKGRLSTCLAVAAKLQVVSRQKSGQLQMTVRKQTDTFRNRKYFHCVIIHPGQNLLRQYAADRLDKSAAGLLWDPTRALCSTESWVFHNELLRNKHQLFIMFMVEGSFFYQLKAPDLPVAFTARLCIQIFEDKYIQAATIKSFKKKVFQTHSQRSESCRSTKIMEKIHFFCCLFSFFMGLILVQI